VTRPGGEKQGENKTFHKGIHQRLVKNHGAFKKDVGQIGLVAIASGDVKGTGEGAPSEKKR